MPKKSIREMNKFERTHHSLNFKMMRTIIFMSAVIAIAAIVYGFSLYANTIRSDYKKKAFELAQTVSATISDLVAQQYSVRTIEKFESLTDEEKLNQDSDEYKEIFAGIEDYGYQLQADKMGIIQKYNNASSLYIGVVDSETNQLIYVIDSDKTETHCPPGSWEYLSEKELEIYTGNTESTIIQTYTDEDAAGDAYIEHHPEYGYLCTAGVIMMIIDDRYEVGAFCDLDMNKPVEVSIAFLWQYALILIGLIAVIVLLTYRYIKKKLVTPINQLAEAAASYSNDKRDNIDSSGHFNNLNIKTGDEIENLSLIMNDMEVDMNHYINNLTTVTAEKERISTELDVAKQIQEGMVSHLYPPFPDRTEFDVYATMNTAKEVGGDFYDFFLIDDDHLVLVMADVSGKGVPAALFMMASKIMINNMSVVLKRSPAIILEKVNNDICKNNMAEMFVTVWLGILEISTGHLIAANAGHEFPAVKSQNGIFEIYKDPHGLVIGGMEGVKYKEYSLNLLPGDSLFLYTDGVTEATDKNFQLFGMDRMIISLNKNREKNIVNMLEGIQNDIEEFVGDAPQFDDITMMCLHYYGSKKE